MTKPPQVLRGYSWVSRRGRVCECGAQAQGDMGIILGFRTFRRGREALPCLQP